jgi:hypothetical protein
MKYQIGGIDFKSKKEIKDYCSAILCTAYIGQPLHGDFAFFMGLIAIAGFLATLPLMLN